MVSIKISEYQSGQRLNKFLQKYLDLAPTSFIYKMLRKKNIVLNDKKAQGDEILYVGDTIVMYLADDTISKFRSMTKENEKVTVDIEKETIEKLSILYEDSDILVVHKPVGVLSQKASAKDYSINEQIVDYCKSNGILKKDYTNTFRPSVCNRLDRNTSGIIVAGITLKGSQNLTRILKLRVCDKYYYTIVCGHYNKELHQIAYIGKNHDKNLSEVSAEEKPGYKKIETEFEVIDQTNGFSLLQVKLITGKSHQIRAHLAYLGFPIVGDPRYGKRDVNRMFNNRFGLQNQLLHAGKLVLHRDDFFSDLIICDPLPEKFDCICTELGLKKS
ncbi:MAG: RluA family pseudouridine synthase [Eubacteriales bacterium]|nr:RluA family pseudouridine synthase [Eubacteriales bacterium]